MSERLIKIRQKYPNFDRELVDDFDKKMPELLEVMIDGKEYDCHIGSKEVAMLAQPYIENHKGEHIGFHWAYDDVITAVKSYINFDNVDFYEGDIFVWANVKYGDMAHITGDTATILKYAIAELTDSDFPYYDASKRAYYWLKKHVENAN